jgi:hypothetical protein
MNALIASHTFGIIMPKEMNIRVMKGIGMQSNNVKTRIAIKTFYPANQIEQVTTGSFTVVIKFTVSGYLPFI